MISLQAGAAKAHILPDMGGGLAGLWLGGRPVLRPWSGRVADGPFALACNVLLPFSNRISGSGFLLMGRHQPVPANLPGEALPIHGDAFQRPWEVIETRPDSAVLGLEGGSIGPFRYAARLTYRLSPQGLTSDLSLTSAAPEALPYGLGFHPWFPRTAATLLQFRATGTWPEGPGHLPATQNPLPMPAGGPWAALAPLPDGWINQGFSGWEGAAQIVQDEGAVSCRLTARGLGTVLLYSPSASADFFCFEPVSHPVDAHNLPGRPGLVTLAPGESLSAAMTLSWGDAAA